MITKLLLLLVSILTVGAYVCLGVAAVGLIGSLFKRQIPFKLRRKYVLCPGYISSRYDADEHFISAHRLAELYGIPMKDCYVEDHTRVNTNGLIRLHPQYDGNYELPRSPLFDPEIVYALSNGYEVRKEHIDGELVALYFVGSNISAL